MKNVTQARVYGILLFVVCVSVLGCGVKRVGNTDVFTTEADERVVYAHRVNNGPGSDPTQARTIFCAEPSPDLAKAVQKRSVANSKFGENHRCSLVATDSKTPAKSTILAWGIMENSPFLTSKRLFATEPLSK